MPRFAGMQRALMAGLVSGLAIVLVGGAGWAATPKQAPAQAPVERAFDSAWRAVVFGAQKTAQAGDWVIEKSRDGAVVAYRSAEAAGKTAQHEVTDATILTKIKTRLASDPSVSSGAISVDVQNGVVTLNGQVRGPDEAKTALRLAQQTSGVTHVVSRVTWPGMPAAPAAP